MWVAATFATHPLHVKAKQILNSFSAQEPGAFCRATQQSFLRLLSTESVFKYYGATHFGNRQALAVMHAYLALPRIVFENEPTNVSECWHQLASIETASPKVWMDAYLAAFAICAAIPLITFDRDFKKYRSDGLNLVLLGE